jgi:hypothetical protein
VDYENTLKWIRHIAGAHYWGGAFEPGHMRDIANVAANALDGKVLPDYDTVWAKAREKGQTLAAEYAEEFGWLT